MTRPSPLDTATFHFVQNLDDAWEFKRWLGTTHANHAISFDTETTGLSAYEPGAAIRLAQFGDTEHGWAIPWGDWRGLILEALKVWEGDLITHHSKFDVNWVETHSNFRFPRHRLHDTMIQARIVDPLGSGALKTLSDQYIDRRRRSANACSTPRSRSTSGVGPPSRSTSRRTGSTPPVTV